MKLRQIKKIIFFSTIILSLSVSPNVKAQEYILPNSSDTPIEAETVSVVDGVQLFIWDAEAKEMAVKCDGLMLYPYSYGRNTMDIDRTSLTGGSYSGNITVPANVEYEGENYTVTRIAFGAFINCPELESVTLPETITTIGCEAFYNCPKLNNVVLPKHMEELDYNIFGECPSLKSIDFKSIGYIGPFDERTHTFFEDGQLYLEEVYFDSDPPIYPIKSTLKRLYIRTTNPAGYPDPGEYNPDEYYDFDRYSPEQFETTELIVPTGSAETYKSTYPYSKFKHIRESNEHTGIPDIKQSISFRLTGKTIEAYEREIYVYNILGIRISTIVPGMKAELPTGFYIVTDGINAKKVTIK